MPLKKKAWDIKQSGPAVRRVNKIVTLTDSLSTADERGRRSSKQNEVEYSSRHYKQIVHCFNHQFEKGIFQLAESNILKNFPKHSCSKWNFQKWSRFSFAWYGLKCMRQARCVGSVGLQRLFTYLLGNHIKPSPLFASLRSPNSWYLCTYR